MTASRAFEPSQWSNKFLVGDDQTNGHGFGLHHGQTRELLLLPGGSIPMLSDHLEVPPSSLAYRHSITPTWPRQRLTPTSNGYGKAVLPLSSTPTLHRRVTEGLLGLGLSQDTAIVIPEDSDTEDEGYGGEDSHSLQSYTTTATSIATHPTIDALSNEESCDGSQNVPVTPSRSTYSPTTTTPEVTALAPQSDSDACPNAGRDDATRVQDPSLPPGLLPELPSNQAQDQDRRSCSSSDTESGSLLGTQTCPPSCEGLSRHHSRRTSLRTREMVQDKDGGDTDTEDSDSEDGLDVPQDGRDEDYCPSSPEVQRYDSEDSHEDKELNRGKRRKYYPLSNVSLKRITEGNRMTFQLQFEWTPESNQLHAQTSVPHPED
ncbi:hypothetical protein F53441_14479 [Fusarium austroafricanum]|uniref:Uncharacterized protein n=1 Tax=Fusarium austroafricanum TaxID=2364996 RepID=A0A8H4NFH8_9HYPO|nr:hypothetical protein F53441_14479 [Fusarium austroafricanum]